MPSLPSRFVLRAVERELRVWRHTWRGSVVSSLVQPLMFLGAMGLGLGGLVDENTGEISTRSVADVSYLEFVTPGLMVAAAMMAMAGGALWGVMAGIKWMGQFRSMVHTAMTPADVYWGLVLASGIRASVTGACFVLVAALLGGVVSPWGVLAVAVAALVGATTTASLAAFSVGREDDATFPLVMRLGIIPLFLFSGTFFPVDRLPDAIEPLAWLSPLFHAAEAARMATTGSMSPWFLMHLGVLVAIVAFAAPIGVRRITRRLTP